MHSDFSFGNSTLRIVTAKVSITSFCIAFQGLRIKYLGSYFLSPDATNLFRSASLYSIVVSSLLFLSWTVPSKPGNFC